MFLPSLELPVSEVTWCFHSVSCLGKFTSSISVKSPSLALDFWWFSEELTLSWTFLPLTFGTVYAVCIGLCSSSYNCHFKYLKKSLCKCFMNNTLYWRLVTHASEYMDRSYHLTRPPKVLVPLSPVFQPPLLSRGAPWSFLSVKHMNPAP